MVEFCQQLEFITETGGMSAAFYKIEKNKIGLLKKITREDGIDATRLPKLRDQILNDWLLGKTRLYKQAFDLFSSNNQYDFIRRAPVNFHELSKDFKNEAYASNPLYHYIETCVKAKDFISACRAMHCFGVTSDQLKIDKLVENNDAGKGQAAIGKDGEGSHSSKPINLH